MCLVGLGSEAFPAIPWRSSGHPAGALSPAQVCSPCSTCSSLQGTCLPDSSLEAHRAVATHSVPIEIQALGPAELGFMLPHAGSLTYSGLWIFLESQEVHRLRIVFLNA